MRAEGRPAWSLVASTMASAWGSPAWCASSYQRANSRWGSAGACAGSRISESAIGPRILSTRCAAARARWPPDLGDRLHAGVRLHRETNDEIAALARRTVDLELAAVGADDAARDRQADAEAGGVERERARRVMVQSVAGQQRAVEQVAQLVLGDADAAVADLDHDLVLAAVARDLDPAAVR